MDVAAGKAGAAGNGVAGGSGVAGGGGAGIPFIAGIGAGMGVAGCAGESACPQATASANAIRTATPNNLTERITFHQSPFITAPRIPLGVPAPLFYNFRFADSNARFPSPPRSSAPSRLCVSQAISPLAPHADCV